MPVITPGPESPLVTITGRCLAPAPAETPPSLSSNKNKSSPGLASSWAVSSKNWPCLPPTAAARQPSGAVIVTQSLDDNPKIITIWGF